MKIITQKALSKQIGINNSFLGKIIRGKSRPGTKIAAVLERETGIGIRVWLYGNHTEMVKQLESVYGPINRKLGRPRKQGEE